jgi:hypothetical protein
MGHVGAETGSVRGTDQFIELILRLVCGSSLYNEIAPFQMIVAIIMLS